ACHGYRNMKDRRSRQRLGLDAEVRIHLDLRGSAGDRAVQAKGLAVGESDSCWEWSAGALRHRVDVPPGLDLCRQVDGESLAGADGSGQGREGPVNGILGEGGGG